MVKLLTELTDFSYDHEEVKQSREEGGPLVVVGVLQRCDVLNQNGRVYPRNVLEPQIEAYKELVRERRSVGELDHADDPVVNLSNASHVITDIWMEEDGTVKGKVEVLENTPKGAILKALIEANIKLGISSRALGSITQEAHADVVNEDLYLVCWDFVSEPSTPGAWMMKESKDYTRQELKQILTKQQRVSMAANNLLAYHKKLRGE